MSLDLLAQAAAQVGDGTPAWVIPIAVAVLGGGFFGGLAFLVKARPERDRIVIETAQGAVVLQAGVLDDLREQLAERGKEINSLRAELDSMRSQLHELEYLRTQVHDLEQEVKQLTAERDRIRRQRDRLTARVRKLEALNGGS